MKIISKWELDVIIEKLIYSYYDNNKMTLEVFDPEGMIGDLTEKFLYKVINHQIPNIKMILDPKCISAYPGVQISLSKFEIDDENPEEYLRKNLVIILDKSISSFLALQEEYERILNEPDDEKYIEDDL